MPTPPAKEKKYNGEVRKDKVLVLLVEFDDFKHNNVDKYPNYMYSDDFNQEHYQKCYLEMNHLSYTMAQVLNLLRNTMKSNLEAVIQLMELLRIG